MGKGMGRDIQNFEDEEKEANERMGWERKGREMETKGVYMEESESL